MKIKFLFFPLVALTTTLLTARAGSPGLWSVYEDTLKNAKYVDLTHTLTPASPVWKGFGPAKFGPTLNPETGALIAIGYPKFQGGLGGYAHYVALCPPDWKYGVTIDETPEAPLPKKDKVLQWDDALGIRARK